MSSEYERRLLFRELAKRKGANVSDDELRGHILRTLFEEQRALHEDKSRDKSALCPRRAGKTTYVPAEMYATGLANPGRISRYWGITQDRAYQLMWQPLVRLASKFSIRIRLNEQLMTIWLPNGHELRLVGADKAKEAEKKRGDATVLDIVDECALFGDYLKTLVEEVIEPCHIDFNGVTVLLGSPGIVWRGYWFEVTGPDESKRARGWSRHAWDVYRNPYLPHARDEIERIRIKRGWPLSHPTYLREYRGQWVKDTEGLFYAYDPDRNEYDGTLPVLPAGAAWSYTLGWDIGWDDAMALTVWAESDAVANLYEVHSWKRSHVLIHAVAEEVRLIEQRFGHIPRKVADAGGVGKLTVEEMAAREHLYFEPAQKRDKPGIVRFMNDDFMAGKIKVRRGSALAEEYATLAKDPEDPTKEDSRCQNHCADAGLYGYRRARHYQHETQTAVPKVGTRQYFDKVASELEQQALDKLSSDSAADWWER